MNFTPAQIKILAVSATVARFSQPTAFSVLQHILRNRSWQQERKHEEEIRAGSVGTRSPGSHPDWDKRPSTTAGIRLLLGLLPEWVRQVLWRALRERYEAR